MTALSQIRLRFLLGEWLIATWRPRMVPIEREEYFDGDWPTPGNIPDSLPLPKADGFSLRRASPRLFAPGVGRLKKWVSYVPRIEKLHYVELTGTFEAYLGRRSAKSRYNLKRAIQRLQGSDSGSIIEILTDAKDMARFQNIACLISRETYQSKLLDAGFPESSEYLASMEAIAEEGRARAYLLKEEGKPIAFAWCTSQERQLTYQIIGYLPSRAAVSPGSVLLTLILEDVFRAGHYDRFDFGVGDAPYKSSFATHTMEFADVYLFRPKWRSILLVNAHWQTEKFSVAIGNLLERWGFKKRIKLLMRRIRGAGPS